MTKLNPEKFTQKVSVYFDFSNNGKIIMTDKIVYIGSENYSEESEQNTEFGFISRDINFIDYIKNEVFFEVQQNSGPYYEHDFTELLLQANLIISLYLMLKTAYMKKYTSFMMI